MQQETRPRRHRVAGRNKYRDDKSGDRPVRPRSTRQPRMSATARCKLMSEQNCYPQKRAYRRAKTTSPPPLKPKKLSASRDSLRNRALSSSARNAALRRSVSLIRKITRDKFFSDRESGEAPHFARWMKEHGYEVNEQLKPTLQNWIRDQVTANDVVLFMKGDERFSPVWLLRPRGRKF